MKDYLSPELIRMDDILEGVYAAGSGWVPPEEEEEEPVVQNHDWKVINFYWGTHNSGHHSDLYLIVRNVSGKALAGFKATITFGLDVIGYRSISFPLGIEGNCAISGSTVVLTHPGAYNNDETLCFSFNNMYFDHKNPELKCEDGEDVKAYVGPVPGGHGSNIPIGAEASVVIG